MYKRQVLTRVADSIPTAPQPPTAPSRSAQVRQATTQAPEPDGIPRQRTSRTAPAPQPAETGAPETGARAAELFLDEAAQVLGMPRERLDLRRTLHDYGIDSITAARLQARTRRKTGRDISLNRLLGSDSLRTLATAVADTRSVQH